MTEDPKPTLEESSTPETPVVKPTESRVGRLKTAFLYVLIAGLAAAAITSVIALLIGSINDAIGKSLLTIFIFFSHSLLILAVLWADRDNHVGRYLLPTAIVALVFASMITTTLGTWGIITNELSWRIQGLYFLALGAVFVIIGTLRLRLAQQALQVAVQTSIALTILTVLAVAPWVLDVVQHFDPVYFRIVSALAILAAAAFLITLVLRGIVTGRGEEILATKPVTPKAPAGLLTIYIIIGSIAGMVWLTGLTGFIVSAVSSDHPRATPYSKYDKNNYR